MNDFLKLVQTALDEGLTLKGAMKRAFAGALISPYFLFKIESHQKTDQAYRISSYELANRLSYFLWASMPDKTLSDLAKENKLQQPEILKEQVIRMLKDPRSEALGSIFCAQWFGYEILGTRVRLDPIDKPWCTDSLMKAMRDESGLFFSSLVRENRPIDDLIKARYTYLNEELAKHYRIRGVQGDHMRRVELYSSKRGGLIGQGSILAITSFPGRTSPVVRGRWILDTLLGTPPPPPPPDVSELSEEIEERDRLSPRQKLELHRDNPKCASCHDQIDPLGFSLENYDYFGRWREKHEGRKIDTQAKLPEGVEFEGPRGLRRALLKSRKDDLRKQLVRKLLAYALGRQLEYYDEATIREVSQKVKASEDRFHTVMFEITSSDAFQMKLNPKSK